MTESHSRTASVGSLTVWWDDPADGATNMAVDECLAAEADRRGGLLVRIYAWESTTVSLGAFQRYADAAGIAAITGLPLVRRPSGGGAIVHGGDLTYAAAVPKSHPWGGSPQSLYDALHEVMAGVLAGHGLAARTWAPAGAAEPGEEAFFCFDRRSPGDLVAPSPGLPGQPPCKVMGSAQRRLATVVLQHGSLLLRHNPDVVGPARHASLCDLCPAGFAAVRPRDLAAEWLAGVAGRLGGELRSEPRPFVAGRGAELADRARRFRDERWTARR